MASKGKKKKEVEFTPATLEQRFKPHELMAIDAETGTTIRLNTKTVLERAEARGDSGIGGTASNSAALHALPRLALDVEKSAQLHMYIEAQREKMIQAVKLEAAKEHTRLVGIKGEPMQWRRKQLREQVFEDRVYGAKELEKLRSQQELELIKKAKELGLL